MTPLTHPAKIIGKNKDVGYSYMFEKKFINPP